jgi:effector-binding domain-containing protein
MDYHFEIKKMDALPTLFTRQTSAVGELPQVFGRSYGSIVQYLAANGEQPCGAAYALYYNLDMEALDVQAGFTVKRLLPEQGEIKAGEIPAGRYATGVYFGAYDQMAPFYNALNQWVSEQGEKVTGLTYEWYFSPPDTRPEDTKTEVWFPLV